MTRKRFIKLLMSYGFPRNFAQIYACAMLSEYGSYEKAWIKYKTRLEKAFDSLSTTMKILSAQDSKTTGEVEDITIIKEETNVS